MVTVIPGDGVLELMRNATSRIVIVAPFIKSSTIRRLLEVISDTVSECICITRWLPEDIASGVCDLEVFDDISQTQGGQMLVHPHLHAKYYSNGQHALVGSCNLTARGFGWATPSNVELAVSIPSDFQGLEQWEAMLINSSVPVSDRLRDEIRLQAEKLKQNHSVYSAPEVEAQSEHDHTFWVPKCPTPDRLWQVYRGRGNDTMVSSAFEAAQQDLAALGPPHGLSQELFTAYVAGILKQMPFLTEIDKLASTGLTDTYAHEFLAEHLDHIKSEADQIQVWNVVKRWLIHFFPNSLRLESAQEVLVKGSKLHLDRSLYSSKG